MKEVQQTFCSVPSAYDCAGFEVEQQDMENLI